jgi:hypothetical protein
MEMMEVAAAPILSPQARAAELAALVREYEKSCPENWWISVRRVELEERALCRTTLD